MSAPFGGAHGQLFQTQCDGLNAAWRRAAQDEQLTVYDDLQEPAAPPARSLLSILGQVAGAVALVAVGIMPLWLDFLPGDEPTAAGAQVAAAPRGL